MRSRIIITLLLLSSSKVFSQETGQLSGSFESNFQYYVEDTTKYFKSEVPSEKIGYNGYLNLFYQKGNFSAGVRYEGYFPALLGYPTEMQGHGIANRFISYTKDNLSITAGNFYEQFGGGNILRTLEQRSLGIDNSIDGLRAIYNFNDKALVKGVIGKQRIGFEKGSGQVRGLDAEINLMKIIKSDADYNLLIGGSYVSKYQLFDGPTNIADKFDLNVDAFAGRLAFNSSRFLLSGEYVYKNPDPTSSNGDLTSTEGLNLKTGDLQEVTASYNTKGLGIGITAKRMYNMDFRSDREANENQLLINFITANTTQHNYRLLTFYPYNAQTIPGEMSLQADLIYSFKKKSTLGGKYGATLSFNYSLVNSLDSVNIWQPGKKRYFQDFNTLFSKKWTKKFKSSFKYVYLQYDKDQVEGKTNVGLVESNTFIADLLLKLRKKKSLRIELQHMATPQDKGNWAFGLLELGWAPHWIFYVSDEMNYGSLNKVKNLHFYTLGAVYSSSANRFELRYGRQRGGLICVGGICRLVPEFTGLSFSITSSF